MLLAVDAPSSETNLHSKNAKARKVMIQSFYGLICARALLF